jgi:hypothetical protein
LTLLADRTTEVPARLHFLQAALERDPGAAEVHYRIAWELLQDLALKDAGTICAQQHDACLALIEDHARRAPAGDSRRVVLESWLLAERGDPWKAEEFLARGCERFPGDVKCLGAWVARALKNDSPRLQQAVNALVAAGCTDADSCASTHLGIGTLFANAGRWNNALTHFKHAAQEASTIEAWRAVANSAERIGDATTAKDARRRVALLTEARAHDTSQPPLLPSRLLPDPAQGTHSGAPGGE